MDAFLATHGYPALFLLSFLAATLIPLGSEWFVIAMVASGRDPLMVLAVATSGNFLGACTTYLIGVWGGPFLVRRLLRIDEAAQARAERHFARYGSWSLLFTWLPVVGDPLCLVAGLLRIPPGRFALLVLVGKLLRYAAITGIFLPASPVPFFRK